jgi:hypothetical protein
VLTSEAKEFHAFAREYLEMAEQANDERVRYRLIELAREWMAAALVVEERRLRGIKLGGENEQSRLNKAEADTRAQALRPILLDILGNEAGMSATAIATELNMRKVETPRPGSRWHAQTVLRTMRRLGMEQKAAPSED